MPLTTGKIATDNLSGIIETVSIKGWVVVVPNSTYSGDELRYYSPKSWKAIQDQWGPGFIENGVPYLSATVINTDWP